MKKLFKKIGLPLLLAWVAGASFANEDNIIWVKAEAYPTGAGTVYTDFVSDDVKEYDATSEFKRYTNGAISDAFIWAQATEGYMFAGFARDNGNQTYDRELDLQVKVRADGYFTAIYDSTIYKGNSSTEADELAAEALEQLVAPTDYIFAVFTKGVVARVAEDQIGCGNAYADKLYTEPGDQVTLSAYGDSMSPEGGVVKYYKFDHWTDSDGNIVGTDREMTVTVSGPAIYYAHFAETDKDDYNANENDPHKSEHYYDGGIGGATDYNEFEVNGLLYSVIDDSSVKVGVNSGVSGSITIPSTVSFGGKTYNVTSIGDGAFSGCSGLTSVSIEEGVRSAGDRCFINCSSLRTVTLPSSLTSLGAYAFEGCAAITSICIPEGITSISHDTFLNCSGLVSVELPEGLTKIDYAAFRGCSSLTSIVIPGNVTSIGDNTFSNCSGLTSVAIPGSVTSIGNGAFSGCSGLTSISIEEGVRSAGDRCFINCSSLRTVTLPGSLTSLGTYAFEGCIAMTSIRIPEGITSISHDTFLNCSGLVSVEFTEGLTKIDYAAFRGCSSLTSVSIPGSVTSIGGNAFYGCSGLTSVIIPSSVTSIGNNAFSGCSDLISVTFHCPTIGAWFSGFTSITEVIIGEEVVSVGNNAFSGCIGLTSVTIPGSVTHIGNGAFSGCSGLTSVSIEEGVRSAGDRCFINCSSLRTVTLPSSLTSLGAYAFEGCAAITSICIPEGITSISHDTFLNCSGLVSVEFPEGLTDIDYAAFRGCSSLTSIIIPGNVTSIGDNTFSNCSGLTSVTIPNSVTSIGNSVFAGCSGLKAITVSAENPVYDSRNGCNAIIETASNTLIAGCMNTFVPDGVTAIADKAFYGHALLTSMDIPEGVTSIGSYAFYNCSWLSSVTIPSSIASIGDWAFGECTHLTSVTVGCATPISINSNVFSNRANATLYVPVGSMTAYMLADIWKEFKEIVELNTQLGDLDNNGTVNIADIVLIIDVMSGENTDAQMRLAADITGEGDVNIADIIAAIDLMIEQSDGSSPNNAPAHMPAMERNSDYITARMDGDVMSVGLTNANDYTAFQMTVTLPEGASISDIKLDESRCGKHAATLRQLNDRQYLVAVYSLNNKKLNGCAGKLFTLDTERLNGEATISDVIFATPEATPCLLEGTTVLGTATGIDGIDGQQTSNSVYDLQGRRIASNLSKSSKGVYIVNGRKIVW